MSSENPTFESRQKSNDKSFYISRRKPIMNAIKIFYMSLLKDNIAIYGVVIINDVIKLYRDN